MILKPGQTWRHHATWVIIQVIQAGGNVQSGSCCRSILRAYLKTAEPGGGGTLQHGSSFRSVRVEDEGLLCSEAVAATLSVSCAYQVTAEPGGGGTSWVLENLQPDQMWHHHSAWVNAQVSQEEDTWP